MARKSYVKLKYSVGGEVMIGDELAGKVQKQQLLQSHHLWVLRSNSREWHGCFLGEHGEVESHNCQKTVKPHEMWTLAWLQWEWRCTGWKWCIVQWPYQGKARNTISVACGWSAYLLEPVVGKNLLLPKAGRVISRLHSLPSGFPSYPFTNQPKWEGWTAG